MIKPIERKSNYLLTLPTVPLRALVAFVNRDDNIENRDGFFGEIISCPATSLSEGALWVPRTGECAGEVLQLYPRANTLLKYSGFVRKNGYAMNEIALVVSAFRGGITSADRAMKHASTRVLTDLEAFHGLVTLSDDALNHAIGSNLNGDVSVLQHNENLTELEALVRSGGVLADEIRAFLKKLKNAKDARNRHNVYRMVLITRAVQRRAKKIADGKGDTLEAITVIGLDVARYVGAVTAMAAQIRTELSDVQPWWTGMDFGLAPGQGSRRRANFVARLRQYRTEFLAVTAKPFRGWASQVAGMLRTFADCIEYRHFEHVLDNARVIVGLAEVILLREGVSRCITMAQREEHHAEAIALLSAVNHWFLTRATALALVDRLEPIEKHLLQLNADMSWIDIEATARNGEQRMDALLG